MRELKSGYGNEQKFIRVRANTLARLYFRQEFGRSIDDALKSIMNAKEVSIKRMLIGQDISKLKAFFEELEALKNLSEAEQGGKELEVLANAEKNGIDINVLLTAGLDTPNQKYPALEAMEIVWAMAKAQSAAEGQKGKTLSFEKWLELYGDFDVNDCQEDFEAEVQEGFFRKRPAQQEQQ